MWYYTPIEDIDRIINEGILKPYSKGNLDEDIRCLWFSLDSVSDALPDIT